MEYIVNIFQRKEENMWNFIASAVPADVLLLLTHWGRVMNICVSKLTIICSDISLSPGRHLAIIWANAGILLIEPLGANFSEILIEIHTFSFKKMHFKMLSGSWGPSCLCLIVLIAVRWPHDMETLSALLAFKRESTSHWMIPPTKGQWCGASKLSLLLDWTNCWTNNRVSITVPSLRTICV